MEPDRLDQQRHAPPAAVLFDRDGTLVHDVPYNRDPHKVRPVEGAREALDRLRAAGVRIGVVTNQSGVGRGTMGSVDVYRVNRRVEELLGPFDVWRVCPHHPDQGCRCRKPKPGLILSACRALRVPPSSVVVIGDIGSDMEAAQRAGARGILVPTEVTLPEEVNAAPAVARDLRSAVALALGEIEGGDEIAPEDLPAVAGSRT